MHKEPLERKAAGPESHKRGRMREEELSRTKMLMKLKFIYLERTI